MYVRTIKHSIRPGKLDEFDRLWQEFWAAPKAQAAFVGTAVYWGVDRAANTAVSISVWDEHPDEIPSYTALVREFSPRAQAYLSGSPTVDTYQVVQQRRGAATAVTGAADWQMEPGRDSRRST